METAIPLYKKPTNPGQKPGQGMCVSKPKDEKKELSDEEKEFLDLMAQIIVRKIMSDE